MKFEINGRPFERDIPDYLSRNEIVKLAFPETSVDIACLVTAFCPSDGGGAVAVFLDRHGEIGLSDGLKISCVKAPEMLEAMGMITEIACALVTPEAQESSGYSRDACAGMSLLGLVLGLLKSGGVDSKNRRVIIEDLLDMTEQVESNLHLLPKL